MKPTVAVAFCVHHKPWLIMSTLITLAAQHDVEVDFHFLHMLGGGDCPGRESYREYHELATACGQDPQLSPYDERVRAATALGVRTFSYDLENDGALDSGAWYKFIRSKAWTAYDYVLFLGEGSLLTSGHALSSLLAFVRERSIHCVAGGHEKRRMPKALFVNHNSRRAAPTPMDAFHDRMTRTVFDMFSRDPDFRSLLDRWSSDFSVDTQDHVPDIWGTSPFRRRLRDASNRREQGHGFDGALRARGRKLACWSDARASVNAMRRQSGRDETPRPDDRLYVNRHLRPVSAVVSADVYGTVRFHREDGNEWFGAATNHLMSREFLERLSSKLDSYEIWGALDLPFAGTALEVVWGFVPRWLGFDKWFMDAIHRVRKHFVTYRREDDGEGMASYINRYFEGRLVVVPSGDFVRVQEAAPTALPGRTFLPPLYFAGA